MEIDKELAIAFPEVVNRRREKASYVEKDKVQLILTMSEEDYEKLKRVRSLRSHIMLKKTWGDLVGYIAEDYLKHNDPMRERPRRRNRKTNLDNA